MIDTDKIVHDFSLLTFEGKSKCFFESVANGDFKLRESITKSAEEYVESNSITLETLTPDTEYKIKLLDQIATAISLVKNINNDIVIYRYDFSTFRSYSIIVDALTCSPIVGIEGLNSLKVPSEDRDKYWGPSLDRGTSIDENHKLEFKCGTIITAYRSILVSTSYSSVMMGQPSEKLNKECIEEFVNKSQNNTSSRHVFVIPPVLSGTKLKPKLPHFICSIRLENYQAVKNFKNDMSQSLIVWFQDKDPLFSGFEIIGRVKNYTWAEVACDGNW